MIENSVCVPQTKVKVELLFQSSNLSFGYRSKADKVNILYVTCNPMLTTSAVHYKEQKLIQPMVLGTGMWGAC